ncbi:uncharacterized protein G2W53_006136 [Senna tora]|uniref:Uncharacterized protein n=1 Tax=Senna tora TaxID=362788 RepID=A0A834X470_9FABA|nr:uncharacterized protein G2W53_006136 [Senna tora]
MATRFAGHALTPTPTPAWFLLANANLHSNDVLGNYSQRKPKFDGSRVDEKIGRNAKAMAAERCGRIVSSEIVAEMTPLMQSRRKSCFWRMQEMAI